MEEDPNDHGDLVFTDAEIQAASVSTPRVDVRTATDPETTITEAATPTKASADTSTSSSTPLVEKKKKTIPATALDSIEADYEKKLADIEAVWDAETDPAKKSGHNLNWATTQSQYTKEWNEAAGDARDQGWQDGARAYLKQTQVEDASHQASRLATAQAEAQAPEPTEPEEATPSPEETIEYVALKPPEEVRLPRLGGKKRHLKEGAPGTTDLSAASDIAMTQERVGQMRTDSETELRQDISAARAHIADLRIELAARLRAGEGRLADDVLNQITRSEEGLRPMLIRQANFAQRFRRKELGEASGSPARHFTEDPVGPITSGMIAPAVSLRPESFGAVQLGEAGALANRGLVAMSSKTGQMHAPIMPESMTVGRVAGGEQRWRHTVTGQEFNWDSVNDPEGVDMQVFTDENSEYPGHYINPNADGSLTDFMAQQAAGKIVPVGFLDVQQAGSKITAVPDKIRVASARVAQRLAQIQQRMVYLRGVVDPGVDRPGKIASETAQMEQRQRIHRRNRTARGAAHGLSSGTSDAPLPPILHKATPGAMRDIQAYKNELSGLMDLQVRLKKIQEVTLGGYVPSQEDIDRYGADLQKETLPGGVEASKQAAAAGRAKREAAGD